MRELSESGEVPGLRFVSVESRFAAHEAYTDDPYINGIRNSLQIHGFDIAYAIHPNDKGCAAYAEAVQDEIGKLEYLKARKRVEGQVSTSGSDEETQGVPVASRDISLVLDVSGSMSGDPLEATKAAASRFVDVASENGARTALVAYDNVAEVLSDFSASEAYLKTSIGQLSDGGGTNMESGLDAAKSLLMKEGSDRQYIVLMSDGQPNDGLTGEELIDHARYIRDPDGDGRDDVVIYALGFNENQDGEYLLRSMASAGCYISVHDSEDMEAFFQDMADMINGVKFFYVRVACPVDVTVEFEGEVLSSAGEEPNTRTSYGSLTFEEQDEDEEGDPVKVLRLREGKSYDVSIAGTGYGTMDYSIGFVDDEGIYSDFRSFNGIDITDKTAISTTVETAETTTLSVDDDGDGRVDKVYRANANQEGQLVDNGWIVRVIVAVFAMLALMVGGFALWRTLKRHQQRIDARYSVMR